MPCRPASTSRRSARLVSPAAGRAGRSLGRARWGPWRWGAPRRRGTGGGVRGGSACAGRGRGAPGPSAPRGAPRGGAGRGIGRAIALAFAAAGAALVLAARGAGQLEAAAGAIQAGGGRAIAVPADVARADDVRQLVARCRAEYGDVDVLVNNAGVSP